MDYRTGKLKALKLLFWGIVAIAVPLLIDTTLDHLIRNPASGMAWPAFFMTLSFFPFKWMSLLAGAVSLIAAYDSWPAKPGAARSTAQNASTRVKVATRGNTVPTHAAISELV